MPAFKGNIRFKIKTLRHASEMHPDDLPPLAGKGNIIANYDEIVAGIPKQKEEQNGEGEDRNTK